MEIALSSSSECCGSRWGQLSAPFLSPIPMTAGAWVGQKGLWKTNTIPVKVCLRWCHMENCWSRCLPAPGAQGSLFLPKDYKNPELVHGRKTKTQNKSIKIVRILSSCPKCYLHNVGMWNRQVNLIYIRLLLLEHFPTAAKDITPALRASSCLYVCTLYFDFFLSYIAFLYFLFVCICTFLSFDTLFV